MIDQLVRKEVVELKSYPESGPACTIKMDANENEWGLPEDIRAAIARGMKDFPFQRYPDSDSTKLRKLLCDYTRVPGKNLMVGNGSDELINYVVNIFIGPGDKTVIPQPTFSMYGFFVSLAGGVVAELDTHAGFNIDIHQITETASREKAKIVFLCNPNNPTGTVLSPGQIKEVIEESPGIVVVDEAYYEFYGRTVIDWIQRYDNLIVLRTLSKAMAIGGLRVGYLAAGDRIMEYLSRVKVPYNVGSFSQNAACIVLENRESIDKWLDTFIKAREDFINSLSCIEVITVFPTQGNFVLLRMKEAHRVWSKLLERGILTRKFGRGVLEDCLRVTVCPPGQNRVFIRELKECIREVYS